MFDKQEDMIHWSLNVLFLLIYFLFKTSPLLTDFVARVNLYFLTYISLYQIFQNALFHYGETNDQDQQISYFFSNKDNAT